MTPTYHPTTDNAAGALLDLLRGRRIVALAGAGCSTESGIPDYRGPQSAARPRRPIQYQEFIGAESARVRYWSRSMVGWPRIRGARPNAGHRALARLEEAGLLRGVITQNVDGLHQAGGSRRVVELHGSLDLVRCLGCGTRGSRAEYQERLEGTNGRWISRYVVRSGPGDAEMAPDGDAELPAAAMHDFHVPGCAACGGVVKPDVVFFGENVPAETVAAAWRLFEEGDLMLVVGSSLTVYSGRRFVYRAEKDGIPIAVINEGPTRADEIASLKVERRLGEILPQLAASLVDAAGSGSA